MTETIYINGVALANQAVSIEDVSGLWSPAGLRGSDYTIPGRHGAVKNQIRMYDIAQIAFPLFVTGVNSVTGFTTPSTHKDILRANVKSLIRLFSGDLVITHEYPDGSSVQATGRLAYDPMSFERQTSYPESAKIAFVVDVPGAFWTDVNITTQALSGGDQTSFGFNSFSAADAPMDELEVRFDGPVSNPRIEQGNTYLQYNDIIPEGDYVVFYPDMTYSGFSGGFETPYELDFSKIAHFGSARWFELQPGNPPTIFWTHTGGASAEVTLTGRKKYLIG